MTPNQVTHAYFIWWKRMYEHRYADLQVDPFLSEAISAYEPGYSSWLERARRACLLSQTEVARRLGCTRQVYRQRELDEKEGKTTLAQLASAAAAFDCELVYAIRPRSRTRFSERIWKELLPVARQHPAAEVAPAHMRPYSLATCAVNTLLSAKFRKPLKFTKH